MTQVDFLGQFGSDIMVVNAARVSYSRWVTDFTERDANLIRRLARDGHTSPFYHPQAQFRVTAPLYVAAQFKRHHVGFAWNELSRRYTDVDVAIELPDIEPVERGLRFETLADALLKEYYGAIADGVPREHARAILPQATLTTWLWTGSLYAWAKMCRERTAAAAQPETRLVAAEIAREMATAFPVSWSALLPNQGAASSI